MLETLLKKRDFPLIVFLGYPQTILDVISSIVFFIHCYILSCKRLHNCARMETEKRKIVSEVSKWIKKEY
jgi:hypothetical protein